MMGLALYPCSNFFHCVYETMLLNALNLESSFLPCKLNFLIPYIYNNGFYLRRYIADINGTANIFAWYSLRLFFPFYFQFVHLCGCCLFNFILKPINNSTVLSNGSHTLGNFNCNDLFLVFYFCFTFISPKLSLFFFNS